jgi:hypothetical protein
LCGESAQNLLKPKFSRQEKKTTLSCERERREDRRFFCFAAPLCHSQKVENERRERFIININIIIIHARLEE